MPQSSRIGERRFLRDPSCLRIPAMPSTESERCRPPIPIWSEKWTASHRNQWSAWLGTSGRHASESMVDMARIMQ